MPDKEITQTQWLLKQQVGPVENTLPTDSAYSKQSTG
jgi:hypothetical protein